MSVKIIKETHKIAEKFYCKHLSSAEVKKLKKSLNKKKSAISSCIPVKVQTDSVYTYIPGITDIKSSIRSDTYPEELNPLSGNPAKWSNTLKQFV